MSVRSTIAAGIVAAGLVLAVPVAAWAQADDYIREPTEVSGETFTRPERPTRVAGTTVSRDSGTLAVTGGDILGLVALGAGAIGVGTVLVRRGRTRPVTS